MASGQVVLYFEKPEDAVDFALAASAVISSEGQPGDGPVLAKIAEEICKASRITTEGVRSS
jgi:hypothetical protein